ncbi:MAG: NADH-quinone oxidoreductase subunit J [Deltaproteobacteria bacterium]|nr:NADH-quinone oxidoreductase subunit J [Deltaproteobacteria bacterium]MBW1951642.1 NADH-quinone oxidoreductase subunit J [Deltaproteobacteria bacterium]MBW1985742.1 NADH-quinone oxidoreductase subunit J [Deltaproteobacteria bacterium]MBW2134655.1 NADH-quinone oxidoreductase subunit J [Deltaproteobacteria bacterium]
MEIIFFILAAVALVSGVLVVIQVNPVHSALYLILNFFTVAGLYLLAHAEFIAAIQVIVYAGAIMVLFLFVIMLLNLRHPEEGGEKQHLAQKISGAALAGATALLVIYTFTRIKLVPGKEMVPGYGSTESVASSLFTDYLLPFEVTSVLLLVALIGAVILARARD